jgi:hypothetical protein
MAPASIPDAREGRDIVLEQSVPAGFKLLHAVPKTLDRLEAVGERHSETHGHFPGRGLVESVKGLGHEVSPLGIV